MIVNTVTEAKANLSALLERVQNGETIILGKNGKPIAVLAPYSTETQPRTPGRLKGEISIAPDFDETPDEILKFFKGENE
mgnify:CR=1 FL=1